MLREVMRGQDFFRSGVIEALGDHKATYAVDALITIADLDGPLQDDAALALGKVGDRKALPVLAGLQRTAPKDDTAGDCRGHLPARRELRGAPQASWSGA